MEKRFLDNVKSFIIILLFGLIATCANAQIGYQVALLNTATGEARANETVTVELAISDSAAATIYSGSQTATTNELGILSLAVGDATTFDNVDWSKLPLYISATVDGTLIGRTQILNVPVAEYAKRTGVLTKEILCSKTWSHTYPDGPGDGNNIYNFQEDGTGCFTTRDYQASEEKDTFFYYIDGNLVVVVRSEYNNMYYGGIFIYIPSKNCLCTADDGYIYD